MTAIENKPGNKRLSHVIWNVIDPQMQVHISFTTQKEARAWLENETVFYKEFWKVSPQEVYELEDKQYE